MLCYLNYPLPNYDERVTKIVEYIKANYFEQNITPQTFADIVFLFSIPFSITL